MKPTAASHRAAPPAIVEAVRVKLDSIYRAGHFPGATVGVALPDGRTFALAVGMSDTARHLPMRATDRLMSGSVGKTYVAAVAMQLIQEHRLDLDAPIWKFLSNEPWFSRLPNAREITIRHLMTHTSGIVRYEFQEPFLAELTANPMRTWTPADRLAYVLDLTPPFAAGQGWEYSDTNYIVLGVIIERVTGKPYYAELRRRILEPLGLTNTVPADAPLVPGLAQGYAGAANAFGGHDAMVDGTGRMTINPQMEWTGGGIASTADDLARWAKLAYEGRAFDRSLVPKMIAAAVPAKLGPDTKYGLGVIVRRTPLGEAWGHSGFFPGYQAEVMYFPASRVAVAFQVNSSVPRATGASPTRIAIELAKAAGAGTP